MNLLIPFGLNFTTLAIISALFGAIANILARVLLKDIKAKDMLAINFFIMGMVLLVLSPIFYDFTPSFFSIGFILLIAMVDTIANYFLFKTLEKTEVTIATPILSLAPGFTFFFGWLFIGDSTSLKSIFIALLAIILIIFFSIPKKVDFSLFRRNTLFPALIASLLFGISAIPAKYLLDDLSAINAPTLYMFRAGLIALFSILIFDFSIQNISKNQYRIIFFRGLFVITQWILLYYALSLGNAGVTVTLGNITPIFVFIMGVIFLHEKITLKKSISALLILVLSLMI